MWPVTAVDAVEFAATFFALLNCKGVVGCDGPGGEVMGGAAGRTGEVVGGGGVRRHS